MPAGSEDSALLDRLCPILRYDSQGSFPADSPAVLTDRVAAAGGVANVLKRADGTVVASASGNRRSSKLDLGYLGWPEYRDGTKAARSDFVDAAGRDYVRQAREMHRAPYADRVFGHVARDGDGRRYLQYWLFYLFNNKAFLGFGVHEGDWEMVQIKLNAQGAPEAMAFAQHSHGQRCPWGSWRSEACGRSSTSREGRMRPSRGRAATTPRWSTMWPTARDRRSPDG